jgi:FkbM family methyltransferase
VRSPLIITLRHASPVISVDRQRSRVPLPPTLEAAARVAFAWLCNRFGLRERRPLGRFLARTAEFFSLSLRRSVVETQLGSLSVLVSTADRTIARSVYTSGDWDPLLVGSVFDALDAFGWRYRETTFLEVGANFGVYCLPAVADYGFSRAVAYEPDPAAFDLLARNIERNGLRERVSAHNAALSSEPGELVLSLGGHNAGDNRIVSDPGRQGERSAVRVPARTLDDEVAEGRVVPSDLGLVWLDVQGHEFEVLRGAGRILTADTPVVLEYCTGMMHSETRRGLDDLIANSFDVMVDLGWCALTGRLRFQPANAVRSLVADGRAVETDLLLLHHS